MRSELFRSACNVAQKFPLLCTAFSSFNNSVSSEKKYNPIFSINVTQNLGFVERKLKPRGRSGV